MTTRNNHPHTQAAFAYGTIPFMNIRAIYGNVRTALAVMLIMLLTAACNNEDVFFGTESTSTGASSVASITLLASSPQVGSSGNNTVTITAIVKDSDNALLSQIPVAFSADSGALEMPASGGEVSLPLTNESGQATAQLSAGGDFTNRTITVTATADSRSETVNVDVTGTALSISGENSATIGDDTTLTIVLTDSDDNPIPNTTVDVTSDLGNSLSASTLTTNSSGQVQVVVTADNPGADVITATAEGAGASHNFVVSGDQFQLLTPTANANIELGVCEAVEVNWEQNGTPQGGETVNFSTTRGGLYSDAGCATATTTAVTNGAGTASLWISSNNAGPATLTAFTTGGPSTSRSVNFVATVPATISLQANPTTIGPNNGSQSEQQLSTITAIVRDPNNNLVAGKAVRFSIVADNSGGSLTTATATTDNLGRASTTYISSSATTAKDGVVIRAEVDENPTINTTVSLTVAQSALFVRLGTANNIEEPTQTTYDKKYTVLVTDASGNAAANADVVLSLTPVAYAKGGYTYNGTSWVITAFDINLNPIAGSPQSPANRCDSEDVNENGILDAGEDINSDGQLTPGNVTTVPTTVTTGADGTFQFSVIYPQEYGQWTQVRLTATTSVAGTESSDSVVFWLPVASSDVSNEANAPPGLESPFGMVTGDCSTPD